MSNRKEVSKTRVLESVLMLIVMMQLGEGKGVAQEAEQKALLAEESHDKEFLRWCVAAEIEGTDQDREKCTRDSGYSGHVMGHYTRECPDKRRLKSRKTNCDRI